MNTPIEPEIIRTIHKALVIGLTCYGEIEERLNAQDVREKCGHSVPDDLRVMHPTGTADVVSTFAEALTCLAYLEGTP